MSLGYVLRRVINILENVRLNVAIKKVLIKKEFTGIWN